MKMRWEREARSVGERGRWRTRGLIRFIDNKMLVSSVPNRAQWGGGARRQGGDTPVHQVQPHKMEWKWQKTKNKNKNLQSDNLPTSQSEAEFKLCTPKQKIIQKKKVKEKYFQTTTLIFFISYIQLDSDINSSTRSIYFLYHFKVPLIFFWVFTTVQAKHTLQSAHI